MIRIATLFFYVLVVSSCSTSSSHSLNDEEKSMIIREVQQTLSNYYNDIRKSGLEAEFHYLDSSKDFFWIPPGYSESISFDSVAKVLKQNEAQFKLIDNSFDTLRIVPLSNELATYTGRIHSTMTDTVGIVTRISLVETGVIIKRNQKWKLLNGQTNVLVENNP